MPTIERVRASREQPHTAMRGRQVGSGGKTGARGGRITARDSATAEAPVRTPPAGGALGAQQAHTRVLIVADFVSTSEEFHRRLIWLARLLGAKIRLIQLPTEPGTCDPTSTILLEGLRQRLGVPAEICSIVSSNSIDAMLRGRSLKSGDLVLLGRSHRHSGHPDCVDLATRMQEMGCETIVIDDRPEWDWHP